MDLEDMQEFDGAHSRLVVLQETSEGAALLGAVESGAKSAAQVVWTVASPVLQVVGDVALEELKAYAMSLIEKELNKLSGQG